MAFLKHLLPAWKRGIEDKRSTNAAILSALNEELSTAEKEAMKSKILMSLDTSTGEWLDAYGRLFGVLRRDEEIDDDYRKRIIGYILLRRGTIPSIIEAIQNFLQDEEAHVEIYEPYTNVFYLNRSRLNGPDHFLGEYYTFAVIDIKISRPFPEAVIDVINEFKPAGVTVRLTYRPSTYGDSEVVELPLSNSEVLSYDTRLSIMNGMNDKIRGHLNLTEASRDESDTSKLFTTNDSRLNSEDRLAGSFSAASAAYNLATFATEDITFTTDTTIAEVRDTTEALSSDFYTRTGAVDSQYALKKLDGNVSSYVYITLDVHTYFNLYHSAALKEVESSGLYTNQTYLSLIEKPTVQYQMKATASVSNPTPYSIQVLNLKNGEWESIESKSVRFSLVGGRVELDSLEDYLSDTGLVFTRILVSPNMEVENYDLHLHFFELGFTKDLGVRPTISSLYNEVSSAVTILPIE